MEWNANFNLFVFFLCSLCQTNHTHVSSFTSTTVPICFDNIHASTPCPKIKCEKKIDPQQPQNQQQQPQPQSQAQIDTENAQNHATPVTTQSTATVPTVK